MAAFCIYAPAQTNQPSQSPESPKYLSRPPVSYTDAARKNNTQGVVKLRVTFKKNGEIGEIKVVQGLPDGLSEQAVEAAKKIKFEPARRNGKPVTVTKIIRYTFTLY